MFNSYYSLSLCKMGIRDEGSAKTLALSFTAIWVKVGKAHKFTKIKQQKEAYGIGVKMRVRCWV